MKELGVDEVLIYCVNDGAVMGAWSRDQVINGTIVSMFGDPYGDFTKKCGMELVHPGPYDLGLVGRSKRFAMHVVAGIVEYVAVSESEEDPAGDDHPEATCAPALIEAIKNSQSLKK